ncbi:MAG: SGNH/GDSL hydrolase family protein [Promethearchaeota archaeon]
MQTLKELTRVWRKHSKRPVRIIAFGSSNTELHWHSLGRHNWVSWLDCALREWIGRHVTLINQGISGETAKDLLVRIDHDVVSYSPDAVIITIGGNDAMKGFSIEDFRINLLEIIKRIQEIDSIPILQTYYCPLYENLAEVMRQFPEFVDVNRTLASEQNLPLLDQYKYFFPFYKNNRENYEKLMLDGLHVNPLGNMIMGILACRLFYLPDPKILVAEYKRSVTKYLSMMNKYCDLPPRRSRSGNVLK